MQQTPRRTFSLLALATLDAAALITLAPEIGAFTGRIRSPRVWVAAVGPDRALAAVAAAAVWLAAAWIAVALLALAASALPGAVGRVAGHVSVTVAPAALRKLVAGSAGLGMLITPAAASAQSLVSAPHAAIDLAATSLSAAPLPVHGHTTPAPPVWPTDPQTTPVDHIPAGRAGATTHPVDPHASSRAGRNVEVQRGDSLWLLAARRLGGAATPRQVADEWPRWYAVNRGEIGGDPALIRPGQVLRAPADPPTEEASA